MTALLADSKTLSRKPPHGPEGTFGGFTVEVQESSERIDYVFVSLGIQVLRYAALSDQWNGYYPSDHLPVFAEIVLPHAAQP
jgi:endonuclease/exonuclease/phosphatase family metal-dependent hydrolase